MRKRPRTALALGLGVGAYSLAHGTTALVAGLLARALAANPVGGELREGGMLGQMIGRLAPADLVFLGLIATGVKAIASVVVTFLEIRVANQVSDGTRGRAIAALLQRGQRFGGPLTLAALSSRSRDLEQAVVLGVIHGGRALAQLVPLVAALILLSPRLALVGTVALLPFVIVLSRLRGWWRNGLARAQDLGDELVVGVDNLVANLDLWRTYSAGELAKATIASAAHAASNAAARAGAGRAALSGFNEVLAVLALLGCIALAPSLGIEVDGGPLFAFAVVFFMAYRPLRDLSDARGWLVKGSLALAAIGKLAAGSELDPTCAPSLEPHSTRAVCAPEPLVLRNFGPVRLPGTTTLTALPGEVVAIVGPTGSGKTSLLRSLLGLEPAQGVLLFGTRDLSRARIGPPQRPFAWVPQEAPIVADTLIANVALFADATRARRALERTGAARLLATSGDTRLGPGGRALSGGERRLVSLARALASGLPVLLLDEPTEGLDRHAREAVLDALRQLRGERTILLVTHQAEVCAIADRVVNLNAGDTSGPAAPGSRSPVTQEQPLA